MRTNSDGLGAIAPICLGVVVISMLLVVWVGKSRPDPEVYSAPSPPLVICYNPDIYVSRIGLPETLMRKAGLTYRGQQTVQFEQAAQFGCKPGETAMMFLDHKHKS